MAQTEIFDEQDDLTAEEIGEMREETEREIARSAWTEDEPTGDNDRSPERMQDWNGEELGEDGEPIQPEDEEPVDEEAQSEAQAADEGEENFPEACRRLASLNCRNACR